MEHTQQPPLRAWFGDPDLKASVVEKLKQHRRLDEIVQGNYQSPREDQHGGGFTGCAIGCTLPQMYTSKITREGNREWINPEDELMWKASGFHGLIQKYYGIDWRVAGVIDHLFESQPSFQEAADFAVAVIEAIPVGADLSQVEGQLYEAEQSWQDQHPQRPLGLADQRELDRWMSQVMLELLANAPVPGLVPA